MSHSLFFFELLSSSSVYIFMQPILRFITILKEQSENCRILYGNLPLHTVISNAHHLGTLTKTGTQLWLLPPVPLESLEIN